MWKVLKFWCGGKWIPLEIKSFPKFPIMCWLFLSLQLHSSLLSVPGALFWIRSIVHYLLIQLKTLFIPRIGWRMWRKKGPMKLQECMDMWRICRVLRLTSAKKIYMFIFFFFLLYASIVCLFAQCLSIILFWMGL